jgi:hypothetical protein
MAIQYMRPAREPSDIDGLQLRLCETLPDNRLKPQIPLRRSTPKFAEDCDSFGVVNSPHSS